MIIVSAFSKNSQLPVVVALRREWSVDFFMTFGRLVEYCSPIIVAAYAFETETLKKMMVFVGVDTASVWEFSCEIKKCCRPFVEFHRSDDFFLHLRYRVWVFKFATRCCFLDGHLRRVGWYFLWYFLWCACSHGPKKFEVGFNFLLQVCEGDVVPIFSSRSVPNADCNLFKGVILHLDQNLSCTTLSVHKFICQAIQSQFFFHVLETDKNCVQAFSLLWFEVFVTLDQFVTSAEG